MDLENLTALVAATHRLHSLASADVNAVERSNLRAALQQEIEQRALAVIAEARGVEVVEAPPVEAAPDIDQDDADVDLPPLDGPFNAAKVRDTMLRFGSGFIIPELAAELGEDYGEVKKYVLVWARTGTVQPTGYKVGRHVQYEYVRPVANGRTARERRPPPEKATPGAGAERRATGEQIETRRANRQLRSTPGHRARIKRAEQAKARMEQGRQSRQKRRK